MIFKIRRFFKKNFQLLIWVILFFAVGITFGWLGSWYWLKKPVESPGLNIPSAGQTGCQNNPVNRGLVNVATKTIVDGVVSKIDLANKVIEVRVKDLTSLPDLNIEPIDAIKKVEITEATEFTLISKKEGREESSAIKPEQLKNNDNVSIIVGQDLTTVFQASELTAEAIRVIEIQ